MLTASTSMVASPTFRFVCVNMSTPVLVEMGNCARIGVQPLIQCTWTETVVPAYETDSGLMYAFCVPARKEMLNSSTAQLPVRPETARESEHVPWM